MSDTKINPQTPSVLPLVQGQIQPNISPTQTPAPKTEGASSQSPALPPQGQGQPRHIPPAAGGTSSSTTAPVLMGQQGAKDVRTKKFDLFAAVGDPTFAAKDPKAIAVPQQILDMLDKAKTVLLIGHTSPDGDCVGSTLTMGRALEAMGYKVDVCIDDDLYGSLRNIDSDGKVRRAKDLGGKSWDLALIMDVGVPERIGGANDLLLKAGAVAIADHHVVDPKREHFKVAPGAPFHAWVEKDYPAAALLAGAILARYSDRLDKTGVNLEKVYTPALLGFTTDTGWGSYQGLDKEYFRYFKFMLRDRAHTQMRHLRDTLDYAVPQPVRDILISRKAPKDAGLPAEHAKVLQEQTDAGQGVTESSHRNAAGKGGVAVIRFPRAHAEALLALGQVTDPRLIDTDVLNIVKFNRVKKKLGDHDLVTFLIEGKDGSVKVSVRGNDDRARKLAEHLGGGGHDRAAGASIANTTLAAVEKSIVAFAQAQNISA